MYTNINNEIWKPLINHRNNYEVSNHGRIKNSNLNRILKCGHDQNGYIIFKIRDLNLHKPIFHKVHRIVALYFIDNLENKPQVNHKNGIKSDNNVENLEWCNALENQQHARKTGLIKQSGELSVNAKLKKTDAEEIRLMKKNGATLKNICYKFKISKACASYVVNYKTYCQ